MNKMDFSIVSTSLSDYVDANKTGLIAKSSLGAKSLNYLNIQSGVQGKATLNVLNTTVTFGSGAACGWNEAGSSTVTERDLETIPLKVNMSFCDKSLYGKASNYNVKMAANGASLPFEEVFIGDVVNGVAEKLDTMIWQGVNTTANTDFDGFATLLAAQKVTLTNTTVKQAIDSVYEDIDASILDKAMIFVGMDTFRGYVKELTDANLFHYAPAVDGSFEVIIPGTNTKVVGLKGIDTKDIFAADPANLFFGCDLANDQESFDFWYSKDNREFRLAIGLSGGVQVAFPTQVIFAERA